MFWNIAGTKVHCLLDSGCKGIMMSSEFIRANKLPKLELEKPVILQLACVGSKPPFSTDLQQKYFNETYNEYFDITNVGYYDVILEAPFLWCFEILLDFKGKCVEMGKYNSPINLAVLPQPKQMRKKIILARKVEDYF